MFSGAYFYRSLLRLYPHQFYNRYGPELAQLFRDCARDHVRARGIFVGLFGLWLSTLFDLAVSIPAQHFAVHELDRKAAKIRWTLIMLATIAVAGSTHALF